MPGSQANGSMGVNFWPCLNPCAKSLVFNHLRATIQGQLVFRHPRQWFWYYWYFSFSALESKLHCCFVLSMFEMLNPSLSIIFSPLRLGSKMLSSCLPMRLLFCTTRVTLPIQEGHLNLFDGWWNSFWSVIFSTKKLKDQTLTWKPMSWPNYKTCAIWKNKD